MSGIAELELRGRDVSWASTIQKAGESLKGMSAEAAGSGNRIAAGFSAAKAAVIGLASAYGASQVFDFLKQSVAAAAEAETANVKLAAALKATGQYSSKAAEDIDGWASSLMSSIGVTDELGKSLIAYGVSMGRNVDQSKRLVEAAANMGAVFGSVEGAMQMLIRASDGDVTALKRFGIEVTEAEAKSRDFESVLRKVETAFSGQASAAMNTYAGRIRQMNDAWGETKEAIGTVLLPTLVQATEGMRDFVNEYLRGIDAVTTFNREMAGDNPFMKAAQEHNAAQAEFEKAKALYLKQVEVGASDFWVKKTEADMRAAGERLRAAYKNLTAESFFRDVPSGKGKASAFAAGVDPDAAKKAEEAAAARLKSEQEIVRVNAELARAGGPMQQIVDYYAAMNKEVEELQARLTGGEMFGPPTNLDYNLSAMKDRVAQRDRSAVDPRGLLLAEYQNLARVAEQVTDPLQQLGAEFEEEARLADYRKQAQAQLDKTNMDSAAAATAKTKADMAAAQAAYSFAQVLVGVGVAAKQGNMSGVAGGIGSGMMMGGALMTGPAAPYVFAAGAVLSVLGGAGAFGDGQRSPTDAQRRHLYTELSDVGLDLRRGGERTNKIYEEEFRRLAALGKEHLFDAWVDMITDSGADGVKAAGMLSKELGDMNLSFYETADAVAYIAAQHENLSMAQARVQTAMAGVFSMSILTAEELNDLVNMYQDGTTWQRQYADLQERINRDLEAAAATPDKSPARDQALAALEQDRATYIDLLKADLAAKREWEDRLKSEGLNNRDLAATASGIDRSNYLLASIEENTRKPIDPVDGSTERAFVRAADTGGYQHPGTGPLVINLKMDGKTITTAVVRGMASSGRRREV